MPEVFTLAHVIDKEQAVSSRVGVVRSRQGRGSRTAANFRSAITSIRTHRRCSLLAVSAVWVEAVLVMAIAILLQGINILSAIHMYVRVMTILLISLGAGAFCAGGLIMMNILVAEGMERSREFNIRLIVGARRRDIRDQLLFEALLLSLVGGVVGSMCGLLIGFALAVWLQLSFVIHPIVIVLLVSASVVPGIACGFYQALKLSQRDFERVVR